MPGDASREILEDLYETVLLLASEQGRIEERLRNAYFSSIHALDPLDFPADARLKLESIRAELEKMYADRSPAVDRNSAINLALEIILLYDGLAKK